METKKLSSEEVIIDLKDDFAFKPFGFVLFAGKNGTGKSFAAMSIYNLLSSYSLPAYDHEEAWFITQADLNMLWSDEPHRALLKALCDCKLLIIDDLGTRAPSTAFMDFLYALVDKRYTFRLKLGTIITTNLTSVAMREQFGDAFLSRVASGRNYVFTGEDRRFNNLGF